MIQRYRKICSILITLIMISCLFLLTPLHSQAASRVQPTGDTIVIVIDPGHGGENEGTIENGFQEKSMTLITAMAMYEELCQYDNVEVYLTRTEDRDLILKERAEFAASVNADFLFSIHYNASVDHDLFGSEVWISAAPPYNAYGYQFGYQQMLTMRDMGLFLRGVKTKINDRDTDYYGVIREATALSVPAVIIEHCHVDEERDVPFCDTEEELIAFGKADALSVAKYFGLKSSALGVDYSEAAADLPEVQKENIVQSTLWDETPPDVCMIGTSDIDYDNGTILLQITAADYDSPLIYYDYSYDGGLSYSPLQAWPGSDVLNGTYTDTFTITLQIPSGVCPSIIVRAYNEFDAFTESNMVTLLQTFSYGEDAAAGEDAVAGENDVTGKDSLAAGDTQAEEDVEESGGKSLPGTDTFLPAASSNVSTSDGEISFLTFLKVCLVIVISLFIILLISRGISNHSRKKRRRQRRKEEGNSKNHPK